MSDVVADKSQSSEFPRRYVAADADFGQWPTAEFYYRELAERPIDSADDLEQWLLDFSELDGCFDDEETRRYVAMTCQTDDEERQQRYLHFIENVSPQRKPWHDQLRRRFVELATRLSLPATRYEVLLRSMRNAIDLYREENVPLLTEDEKLQASYQQITGSMTCHYADREHTLQQMSLYQEEPDRKVREETWRLVSDRYLEDAARLNELYERMVKLRHQIARNADCTNYRDYAFRGYERFDYTPEECLRFHDAIEAVVVPAVAKLAEQRKQQLGLEQLRPWDMSVDVQNRPPLRPFQTEEELSAGCTRVFERVEPELGSIFNTLREQGLLDLGSRKGKAPGGYQTTFYERRVPFIFMNAVGTESDVRTLLHEGGHAFHTWACRNEPLLPYRSAPIEFAEVASMGMECLALPHIDVFYSDDADRARKTFFERIVMFFPFMARIDALQHHVYTHVDDGLEAWNDYWQTLTMRFSPHIDYTGLQAYDRHAWHRKLHIFEVPFYYVEYGIAQLGALQVWLNARQDYERAVSLYRNALALGGARPLPELFQAAGCKFDFSEATLRPLIDAVMEEIDRL